MAANHTPPSRHSSVAPGPLAPLEYLQNQRRGSITDPSLHATPRQSVPPHFFKPTLQDPRPASPYVFGSATHATDNSHLRKLLRTPSPDHSHDNQQGSSSRVRIDSFRNPGSHKLEGDDPMNVDDDAPPRPLPRSARHMSHEPQGPQFDYTMRRHSIAVGHARSPSRLSAPHGVKRKMSADPAGFPTVGEEGDPPLSGPGVPSGMALDPQAPAPKRRGSAIDTQRIAQLSLNDRRDSHDGRAHQWWANDRRDSTASAFSNVSTVGGDYSPGHSSGDSPHGRQPPGIATFAWPSSHPAGPDQPGTHNEVEGVSATPRTLDPAVSVSRMPPSNFPPDRRMSVPDASAIGPTRSLRSRSRPPSRSKQRSPEANHSGPSSAQDDPVSAPSPTASGKHFKESSSTAPYSRSPELRVSHKLAERKRRKEMKELFDELRDQLPADRGMKASKWEILSKAIEFVHQLKQGHQDMAREIEVLRHEVETLRPGSYPPGSTHPPGHFQPPSSSQQTLMTSRPTSQNTYPPSAGGTTGHNGSLHRTDGPPS